jgi:hypothetical protein
MFLICLEFAKGGSATAALALSGLGVAASGDVLTGASLVLTCVVVAGARLLRAHKHRAAQKQSRPS